MRVLLCQRQGYNGIFASDSGIKEDDTGVEAGCCARSLWVELLGSESGNETCACGEYVSWE